MFLGIEALLVLLTAHRSLGITQVATELKLSKSTTHNLLGALTELGFVEQNKSTRRYSISPQIFRFLHRLSNEYGPNSEVKRLLRTQARKLNASIFITALSGHTTYALCASGPDADTFLVGAHGPAHDSSAGKVLVAQRDESEWAAFAPKPDDKPASPYANRNPDKFLAELRAARVNGVAWNIRERDGISCSVAAPLLAGDPPPSRAVAIALPYNEWVARDREELAAAVKALAVDVTRALRPW